MNPNIYRQTDKRWKSLPYPTSGSSFGGNACGACSVLHCIIEQTKYAAWTPKDIQPYMKQFAVSGQGTLWSGISTALKHYGMQNVKWFKQDAKMSEVFAELNKKNRIGVILFSSGKGPDGTVWTTGGHYIAFTAYKYENNKHWFYMKDSGDRHHDGWYAYETSMKGRVPQVWTCTVPAEEKWTKPTTKYSGKLPADGTVLKNGSKGANVKLWQEFINWYAGKQVLTVDSSFGSNTAVYTAKFQETEGITNDGIVGKNSLAKAKLYLEPEKKGYSGPFPSIHVKRTATEVANAAAEWEKQIAKMNAFHYGEGGNKVKDFGQDVYNITHSSGCYFCGTNYTRKVKKIKALKRSDLIADNWYKTYVCNTIQYSAYVHGGLSPAMDCSKNGSVATFANSSIFKNLGHIAFSDLKKGDVLLQYKSDGTFQHAIMYTGDGKFTHATSYVGKFGTSASNNSIITKTLTETKYKSFSKVCRYNKSIDNDIVMKAGEYSTRVGEWQDYLNWYFDGAFYKECGGRDNFFGDNTKQWTAKFQEAEIGKDEGDGLVGNKTIAAAKAVKK